MNKNILTKKVKKKQLIILFIIVAAIASISYSKFYSKKAEKYQMLMRNVKGLSGILVNNNCWKHEDKFSGII